jgi:hypothetical protein
MDSPKRCKDCGVEKPADEFYVSSVVTLKTGERATYLSTRCKPCHSARTRRGERKVRDKNLMRIWRYLETRPCVDCGEDNPLVLSFDHRDRSQKTASLADMMKLPWPVIEKELTNCDVRCMNHHTIKTAAELNWFRAPELRDYVLSWPENKKMYQRYAA